jgi:hypothetical protein
LRLSWKTLKSEEIKRILWRRGSESNRRIKVLQTSPLPLGYRAITNTDPSPLRVFDCELPRPSAALRVVHVRNAAQLVPRLLCFVASRIREFRGKRKDEREPAAEIPSVARDIDWQQRLRPALSSSRGLGIRGVLSAFCPPSMSGLGANGNRTGRLDSIQPHWSIPHTLSASEQ